jgi:hypothetical protein
MAEPTCNQEAKGGSRKEKQITLAGDESGLVIDPELLAQDPEAFQKTLIEQVRVRGGTRVGDAKSVFQDILKQTLEAFLEVEREEQRATPSTPPRAAAAAICAMARSPCAYVPNSAKSRSKSLST